MISGDLLIKKVFDFFFRIAPSEVEFSKHSGINCTKQFFEIRPGTRFFELISILVHIKSHRGENRNQLEKAYARSNFEKRFLSASRIQPQRTQFEKKIENFFTIPFI